MPDRRVPTPSRRPTSFAHTPIFNDPLAELRRAPRLRDDTVSIGGKTYVERDNGRANVLVPQVVATAAPDFLSNRADAAANRAAFMAAHPLGAGAYGAATLFNAPQGVRDSALVVGSVMDTILLGGAPSAVRRPVPKPPPTGYLPSGMGRPSIRRKPMDAEDRPTGLGATLEPSMRGTGTEVDRRIKPAGWQGQGRTFNEGRGHLLARQLGGSGTERTDLVTLNQTKTNAGKMRRVENQIDRLLRGGEVVDYMIDVGYAAPRDRPSHLTINATGSRGSEVRAVLYNPKGR